MKKILTLLVTALLCTTSVSAWDNNADAKLAQNKRRVVMMGNSITDYWKNHEVNNHKEFFEDNGALCRGVSSQKTPAMVNRFDDDVVKLKPLVVVIAGGVNDLNDNSSVDAVFANTKTMTEKAVKAGIRPILATVNPSGWSKDKVNTYIAYNKKVKAYCDENGYSFANYFDVLTMGTVKGNFSYSGDYNEMKANYRGRADHSDHLHPSREGYLQMESVLIPLIESNIWKDGVYLAANAARKDNAYQFGYTAVAGGAFTLSISYNATTNATLTVGVNGRNVQVAAPATGQAQAAILLHEGYNTLSVKDASGVSIQKFEITAAPGQEDKALANYFPSFSIMGDSYSTYKGWIDAGVDFGSGGYEYPQDKYDLTSVDDTWWKQFEKRTGVKLEQNNSISGTCMSYISLNGSGTTKTVSFANRVTKMRQADLFIIEGGTNDFSGGRTTYSKATDATINGKKIVGDYKWDGFEADMEDYRFVRPTVAYLIYYLQHKYPGCTVVFMANNSIPAEGRESFKTICDHYGAIYYEMYDIEKTNGHPVKAGMTSIANQLTDVLVNYVQEGKQVVSEPSTFYLYNVGQQKYVKTGGINKSPDTPTLVDSREEATPQVITRQSDGNYLIADADWPKGWGVSGRQTLSISTNATEKTLNWGSNLTPGWTFLQAAEGTVYISYTWGEYETGSYEVEPPAGQTYALYFGNYAQDTSEWNRAGKNDVKEANVYGVKLSDVTSFGENAQWKIIPVKGVMPDVIPYVPTGIKEVNGDRHQNGKNVAYNLNGQRVNQQAKGIVIVNGKKHIK